MGWWLDVGTSAGSAVQAVLIALVSAVHDIQAGGRVVEMFGSAGVVDNKHIKGRFDIYLAAKMTPPALLPEALYVPITDG